jgi:hypothetical protein
MDYVDQPTALRAIASAIRNDVIPHLDHAYARGQLWAAIGLLNNIAVELDQAESDIPSAVAAVDGTSELLAEAERLIADIEAAVDQQVPLETERAIRGALR